MEIYLRLLLASLIFFFTPGYLLSTILLGRKNLITIIDIIRYFSLSMIILTFLSLISYLLQLSYNLLTILFLSILLILLFFILFKRRSVEKLITLYDKKQIFLSRIVYFLGIIFVIIVGFYKAAFYTDTLDSLGAIRKLYESISIVSQDHFYKDVGACSISGYNTWYLVIAWISKLTKVDPVGVWLFLPIILTPLILLSFYVFAITLFNNNRIALISTLLFILFHGFREEMWIFLTSPDLTLVNNFIFFPIALTFNFKYIRENNKLYLICGVLLGLVIASIHLTGLAILLLSLFSFLIFFLIFKKADRLIITKRISTILLFTILFSSIYILLKSPMTKIVNPFYQNRFNYITITEKLGYIDPTRLCAPHYYVKPPFYPRFIYTLSFLFTPFLLTYIRKKDWSIFLFSNTVIPPLIMLNPILVPLLTKLTSFFLVDRLSQLLPVFLVLGFFVDRLFVKFISYIKKPNLYPLLCIFLMAILLAQPKFTKNLFVFLKTAKFPSLSNGGEVNFIKRVSMPNYFNNPNSIISSLKFIDKNSKETSVILSDEETSMFVPAYTKHYVVAVNPAHASIRIGDQREREEAVRKVLYIQDNLNETLSILKKYDVRYIVVNTSNTQWKNTLVSLNKFRHHHKIFQEIYNDGNIFIFSIRQFNA